MGWSLARGSRWGCCRQDRGRSAPCSRRACRPSCGRGTDAGLDAAEALADESVAAALLQHAPTRGFRTQRSPEYLAWRTSLAPLAYRVLWRRTTTPPKVGSSSACADVGTPSRLRSSSSWCPTGSRGRLVRRMLQADRRRLRDRVAHGPSAGLLPLPGQGPLLTTRPLAGSPPPPGDWTLTLGDVELF